MLHRPFYHSFLRHTIRPLLFRAPYNNASCCPAVYSTDNVDPYTAIRSTYSASVSEDDPLVEKLFAQLVNEDRASLARSITLIESSHPYKQAVGQFLLTKALAYLKSKQTPAQEETSGRFSPAFRIGFSGPPGSGKSTFIESFGLYLLSKGHRIAVLAVDPSSQTSGGSLLADKTRMMQLSVSPGAYIRPSPSAGTLGGVARYTSEATVLCEAAGYDVVLIETVGVGQSEFAVADMVDMFCLILPPAGGDELQGLKRGIMEMADIILVNKYDGDTKPAARRVAMEYTSALKFIRPKTKVWKPKVLKISAFEGTGLDEAWSNMQTYRKALIDGNEFTKMRGKQRRVWMWRQMQDHLLDAFLNHPDVKHRLKELETKVTRMELTPGVAADYLLKIFRDSS